MFKLNCDFCGEKFEEGTFVQVGKLGLNVCESCYERLVPCKECGFPFLDEDLDENQLCENCR